MARHLRPTYYRMDRLIHNASNFNRQNFDDQFKQNNTNMVQEAQMKRTV